MPRSRIRRTRQPRLDNRQRVLKGQWIDPFPQIQGSSIEKMVMAELVRRGIWFEHTPQRNPLVWPIGAEIALKQDPASLEPDFLFPQYHIWLEIQGAYFHTLPGKVESDAMRFVCIEKAGWKPIFWWEDDIRARLPDLMNDVPEFYFVDPGMQKNWQRSDGLPFYEGGTGIDHLAGLRKALANRAHPQQNYRLKRRPPAKRYRK